MSRVVFLAKVGAGSRAVFLAKVGAGVCSVRNYGTGGGELSLGRHAQFFSSSFLPPDADGLRLFRWPLSTVRPPEAQLTMAQRPTS